MSDTRPGLAARTGFHCPANGFWRPEDRSTDAVFIFEGSIMPAGSAGSTVWYLEGTASAQPRHPAR